MNVFRLLFAGLSFVSLVFAAVTTEAYEPLNPPRYREPGRPVPPPGRWDGDEDRGPGRGPGRDGRCYRGDRCGVERRPMPPRPPDRGGDERGPGRDYPEFNEQKIIFVNRYLQNVRLDLIYLAGLGYNDEGKDIESIDVFVRQSGPQSDMRLRVNGYREDYVFNPFGHVRLFPQYRSELFNDVHQLELVIGGLVYVDQIVVNLSCDPREDRFRCRR